MTMNLDTIAIIGLATFIGLSANKFYFSQKEASPTKNNQVVFQKNVDSRNYEKYKYYDSNFNGKITLEEIKTADKTIRNMSFNDFKDRVVFIQSLDKSERRFVSGLDLNTAKKALDTLPSNERLALGSYTYDPLIKIEKVNSLINN